MKVLSCTLVILLLYACSRKERIAVQSSPEKIVDLAIRLHDSTETEINNLYEPTADVPFDDTTHVGHILKQRGFIQNSWGQGNWQHGPRIMMLTLQKGYCECEVIKRYYSTQDTTLFQPTESISCYILKANTAKPR